MQPYYISQPLAAFLLRNDPFQPYCHQAEGTLAKFVERWSHDDYGTLISPFFDLPTGDWM